MTEWWAFKPITTAFEKTKKLLLEPFNAWTWLKLMIIVFFVGAGTSKFGNQFSNLFNYPTNRYDPYATENAINSIMSNTAVILLIIGLVLLLIALVILMAYLRNAFSFVLIRALASGDVHVLRPLMENLGKGFRLFVFTLAVGVFTLIVVVLLILLMVLPVLLAVGLGLSTPAGIIVLILALCLIAVLLVLLVAFSLAISIFTGFTYDFVAPMVFFQGRGIVESWRWLWASIKANWQQYGVYVISRWVLELIVVILALFIQLPVVLIFIAVVVVGVIIAAAAWSVSPILGVVIGLLLIPVLIVFLVIMLAIAMPIAVYFRYYSLDVLKQIDPAAVVYSERFSVG